MACFYIVLNDTICTLSPLTSVTQHCISELHLVDTCSSGSYFHCYVSLYEYITKCCLFLLMALAFLVIISSYEYSFHIVVSIFWWRNQQTHENRSAERWILCFRVVSLEQLLPTSSPALDFASHFNSSEHMVLFF
jgi:hypothetical protein